MNWQDTEWNRGVSVHPWGPNGFYLDVPDSSGRVNCILSDRGAYAMNKTITIRYYVHKMSGNPSFVGFGNHVPGGLAPNFRPMLTSGGTLNNRWYPCGIECGFLQVFDHAFTLSVQLKPELWQDVNGKPATEHADEFRSTVTNSGSVCIVYGWQSYFAHGLYVQGGHARFGLWDYRVL